MKIVAEGLHGRAQLTFAVPGQADAHGRYCVGDGDRFDTLAFQRPGRCTRSERIATPLPLATMLRTASTELVRILTLGCCPASSQ